MDNVTIPSVTVPSVTVPSVHIDTDAVAGNPLVKKLVVVAAAAIGLALTGGFGRRR